MVGIFISRAGLGDFFCKGSDGNYFHLWGPYVLCAKSLQSGLTLCYPMNCSPPGSSVPEILQARILEWVALLLRGSSWPRRRTQVSHIAGRLFNFWATREAPTHTKGSTELWETLLSWARADSCQLQVCLLPSLPATSPPLLFNCKS